MFIHNLIKIKFTPNVIDFYRDLLVKVRYSDIQREIHRTLENMSSGSFHL